MKPFKRFHQIRDWHTSRGTLFEDCEFPAFGASIDPADSDYFNSDPSVVWLRPKDIFKKPAMFVAGAGAGDVSAGEFGDSNVAAALSLLPDDEDNFNRVCPKTQNFKKNYCGAFQFHFWQFGKWVEVIIDDRLPTKDGNLMFSKSNDEGEMWPALVEKAYAKLFNSYSALKGARLGEVLIDMTGGTLETITLKKQYKNLFKRIATGVQEGKLMSCVIESTSSEDSGEIFQGLVKNRVYALTSTDILSHGELSVPLIRLRNPIQDNLEWNGDWSDKSNLWDSIPDVTKAKLGVGSANDDGEFWISFQDFCVQFSKIAICNNKINSGCVSEFDGCWVKGLSAGGSLDKETFGLNPQFRFVITETGQDNIMCSVTISLMLKTLRGFDNSPLAIGYTVFPITDDAEDYIEDGCRLSSKYFEDHKPIAKSCMGKFVNFREVSQTFKLPIGQYCIVPSTETADKKGEFYLRVITDFPSNHTDGGEMRSALRMKGGRVKQMSKFDSENPADILELKNKFDQLAGEDGVVSVEELLELMESMSKIGSEFPEMDNAYAVMALFDVDGSGHLDFQEFLNVHRFLQKCERVFLANCAEKEANNMTSLELEKALSQMKIFVPRKILGMAVARHGIEDTCTVSFMDFVTIVCKFKAVMGACREDPTGEKLVMAALIM